LPPLAAAAVLPAAVFPFPVSFFPVSFFAVSFFAGELLAAYITSSKSNKMSFQPVHAGTPQKHVLIAICITCTHLFCLLQKQKQKQQHKLYGTGKARVTCDTQPIQHAVVAVQVYTQYSHTI